MNFQVLIGIEFQEVIKAFLIVSVASFHFAVMLRCSWTDELVGDIQFLTNNIQIMNPFGFGKVREFCAVISLQGMFALPWIV